MPHSSSRKLNGRGVRLQPANRFKPRSLERDGWVDLPPPPVPTTQFIPDHSRSILSTNDSPDLGFDISLNPYRGCEHGCAYCYARPTHEYLELSAGLDFETRILFKPEAPRLLSRALASPRWKPQGVALSGVTDPYQPAESAHGITRECLKVLLQYRNPVAVITKGQGVLRDIDLLSELSRWQAASVTLSVTTLDAELSRRMEPRAATPEKRLDTIERLARAGIPVGVMCAPVIPGLTDHELPALIEASAERGARFFGYTILRLPHGVKDLFADWLRTQVPLQAEKVLNRLRALRGGRLNDARFGTRLTGEGPLAGQIAALFKAGLKRAGVVNRAPVLSAAHFRPPAGRQMTLF